jgi:hypothetical protein
VLRSDRARRDGAPAEASATVAPPATH